MPKINRTRITNFSYNSGTRFINDETFNYYDGESALLNLINGGGKTLLTQVFIQPIIPKSAPSGRKFIDYFEKKKDACYILHEWLLDDDETYLVTGIAFKKSGGSKIKSDESEENVRISYYTFLHQYKHANEYDIKKMPVAQHSENGIVVAKYTQLRKELTSEKSKNTYNIMVFADDASSQKEYRTRLARYGIFYEEWRNIMEKINADEGGLKQLFDKCKTDKHVMQQWVIPHIEKTIDPVKEGQETHQRYSEKQFHRVAKEIYERQEEITKVSDLESFKVKLSEVYSEFNNLAEKTDEEIVLVNQVAKANSFLISEKNKRELEKNQLVEKKEQLIKQEQRIKYEKDCSEILKIQELIEKDESKIDEAKHEKERIEIQLNSEKESLNFMKASNKYVQIKEKEGRIKKEEVKLEKAVKGEEEIESQLKDVRYSLKIALDKTLKDKKSIQVKKESEKRNLENIGDELKNENQELIKTKDAAIRKIGSLEERKKIYEEQEEKLWQKLNLIELFRKMDGQLEASKVEQYHQQYNKQISSYEEKIDELSSNIATIEEQKGYVSSNINRYREENEKNKIHHSKLIEKNNQYWEDEKEVVFIVQNYLENRYDIFEKAHILSGLRIKKVKIEERIFRYQSKVADLNKLISGIERESSYIPGVLLEVLADRKIQCETGQEYLNSNCKDAQEKKDLIKSNPLLPYSIIATSTKKEKIIQAMAEVEMPQIVPVFNYNNMHEKIQGDFLGHSEILIKSREEIKLYIEKVKEEIEQSQKELKRCNNRLNEYNNSIQLINKFKWEKKEVEALKNEISAYFTKIEDKDRQIGEEEDKYEKYETDKIKMTDEKNHIENVSLLNLRKEYAEYKKYLEKENDYQNSIKELAENKAQRDFFVRRINEIKRLLDENKDLINHIKDELNNLTQYITSMHKEYLLVEDVEERKIKKGTINELQAEKSELEKKSNGDVQECKNKIADEKKDIESLKREVSRLKVDIKDCRGIPYAETELNESEYRIEDLQRAIENISDELSEYNGEKDKKIGNIETKTEQLKGKPLLDPENIGGNFTERLQDLNVEKNYTLQRLDDVADERGLIENKSNELRLVLPEQAKYKNVEKLPFNEETDVQKALSTIDELILKYKRKKKENKVLLSNFERLYQRTREKYENKNKEISDALDSLRGQFAQIKRDAELDQKEYEYYFDMSLNIDRLRTLFDEYIKKLKGQLGELENATKELNEIIYKQTIRVFNEIPKIVENSTISIDGESQRMIEIKFDRNLDHNISRDSLFNYLSDCMNKVVAELSSGEKETKVKERIHKYIKMEELLNTISNLDKYQVKMYKVDANPYNRKMKRWKDMKSKDSGGERFVAFFCLLLALTSYGRQGMLEDTKLLKENSSKVLIMDNPFGTITSDHLLKPLFAFAKKHRTQLICLTDIDKASIMNNFDLIYSITIRQKLSDNNELVRFEEKNSGDLKENKNLISLLEQISLQLKTEQINMFK